MTVPLKKIYRLTVCTWTAENPRHDHQLIFPLTDSCLLLVWSEYYVRQPSLIFRTACDKVGGAHEPSIVELRDGRLLCLLRTTQGCIYQAFSEDGGIHWSKPEPTHLDAPDSPPLVKRIPVTGDLLLLWNNVKSHSNWPRTPLTSAISMDDGKTWENIKDIDSRPDHDAAYAAITFLHDEALLTYYTRPTTWARDSKILLKIVPIDWFYT